MPGHKLGRITEDVKRELSAILREVKDPRVKDCFLSIVRVEVTNDLSYCTVYVSTMEGLERTKTAVTGLKSAAGYIRHGAAGTGSLCAMCRSCSSRPRTPLSTEPTSPGCSTTWCPRKRGRTRERGKAEMLSCAEAARRLLGWEDILVLSHASPDGTRWARRPPCCGALSPWASGWAFTAPDPVPEKYRYLFQGLELGEFAPSTWSRWTWPDVSLWGTPGRSTAGWLHLAIDHHATHRAFTEDRWVEGDSAAAAELIYLLLGGDGGPH